MLCVCVFFFFEKSQCKLFIGAKPLWIEIPKENRANNKTHRKNNEKTHKQCTQQVLKLYKFIL